MELTWLLHGERNQVLGVSSSLSFSRRPSETKAHRFSSRSIGSCVTPTQIANAVANMGDSVSGRERFNGEGVRS